MPSFEKPYGFCHHGVDVLDILGFIEDDVVKFVLHKLSDVIAYHGIACQYDVGFERLIEIACSAVVGGYGYMRCESREFLFPVEEQASRHDDERRRLLSWHSAA